MPKGQCRASRSTRHGLEFPTRWVPMPFERRLTAGEYERVALGFIPESMDDKWFIYLEDETLYFHRSWTGRCIMKIRLTRQGDDYVCTDALYAIYPVTAADFTHISPGPKRDAVMNVVDSGASSSPDLAHWAGVLDRMIDSLLLARPTGE